MRDSAAVRIHLARLLPDALGLRPLLVCALLQDVGLAVMAPRHRAPPACAQLGRRERQEGDHNDHDDDDQDGAHPCFAAARGVTRISSSAGWPASSWRPRSSSALSSAPNSTARFEIHSHTRNAITPPSVPYVLL